MGAVKTGNLQIWRGGTWVKYLFGLYDTIFLNYVDMEKYLRTFYL